MTKIDQREEEEVHAFSKHINHLVREFVEERHASRMKESGTREQRVQVHTRIILTSAKSLVGIEDLVDCMNEILHLPDCLPSVERTLHATELGV